MSAPAPLASAAEPSAAASLAAAAPFTQRCENCGNEVPERYCGACGQRLDPPLHSLWHFSQLAAEDLTHADSRLWRTLAALLFRPGLLTREFLGGRRARYLPPLRLYLVVSLAFFLVASLVHQRFTVVQFDENNLRDAKVARVDAPTDLTPLQPRSGESAEARAERVCANANYDGPWAATLQPLFKRACHNSIIDNGRELQAQFLHNLARAMFIFLPLLAGLMMLMYWWPRHYYVEHLLLFVHNHAFVFLVAGVALILGKLLGHNPGIVNFAVFVYFAWYMYRSMRVVYQQGRWLTGSKLVVLASFYLVFAALMAAATSIYSALTL